MTLYGPLLLFVLVLYGLLVWLLSTLVYKFTNKRLITCSVALIVIAIPIGWLAYGFLPGYLKLQALCNASDRSIIYETVSVDGFLIAHTTGSLCRDAWNPILFGSYKYVECATSKIKPPNINIRDQFYRFSVETEGHSDCDSNDELLQESQRKYSLTHKDKLVDQCLAANKISSLKSHYIILYEIGYIDSDGQHNINYSDHYKKLRGVKGLITYWGNRIMSLDTGKVLSIDRDYTFFPGSVVDKFSKKYECENERYINIENVLIPNLD